MRDPDLVFRAQLAAAALEGAWHRWRIVHGLTADPTPTVSSYVGYSLEEPWGQPRVVFGLAAEDAEQLATLLERHDCVGPVYAAVATLPGARESGAGNGSFLGRFAPLPVPRQVPSVIADQPVADLGWTDRWAQERLIGLSDSGADPGEPLFRQAAAAMQEAAAAKVRAEQAEPAGQQDTGPYAEDTDPHAADSDPHAEGTDPHAQVTGSGSLAKAATAARAEAEARIRAALAEYRRAVPADHDPRASYQSERDQFEREPPQPTIEIDLSSGRFAAGRPRQEIYPTEILEPLPSPDNGAGGPSRWSRPADFNDYPEPDEGPRGRSVRRGHPRRNDDPR